MKQKLKKIASFTLSLLCFSLLFYNCSDDHEIYNQSHKQEISNIKFRKITLEDIQNEKIVLNKINNASKIRNLSKSNTNRIINDTINNFSIDNQAGSIIEYDNYISFTFKVLRENGSNFLLENLVISKEGTNDYETYLYQYNINPQELELITQGISIDLTNKISRITLENSNLYSDIQNKEDYNAMCEVETTTYTAGQTCTEGGNHTWADILAGETCKGFGTLSGPWPGYYTTSTSLQPCTINTGGSSNGGTGGGSATAGGGGSGGTVTTTPTTTNYQSLREKCFSQNNPETSNWLNQPENADIKAEVIQYLENSVNPEEGLQSTESCYPQEEVDIINQMINNYVNNIPIVIGPEIPITNIIEYLECFDLNQGATITIFADQPTPNSPTPVNSSIDVGHSFITIKQGMEQMTLGFYPMNHWGTGFLSDTVGQMGNNEGHSFDVSITLSVNAVTLQNIIINAVESATEHYNLNTNNCTDFAIETCNIMGLNVPDCYSNWGLGGGSNPGKFGQHLRTMSLPSGATRNTSGGTAPANHKGC